MDKLREFGRKAMFVLRVISGYEERQIRSHRLELQRRLQQAKAQREALKRIPEQVILSEVRRMVEEMQAVHKKLEETESAINEYFKPIDKDAEIIMNMQLDGEEKNMKLMAKIMHEKAMEEQAFSEGLMGEIVPNNSQGTQQQPPETPSK